MLGCSPPQPCALAVLMGEYKHAPLHLSYSPPPWWKIPVEAISSHYHEALSVHLGVTVTSCQLRTVLYSVFPTCS